MRKINFYRYCILDGKEMAVKSAGWEYRGFAISRKEGRIRDWQITHIESGVIIESGHLLKCLARDSIERAYRDGKVKKIQDFLTSDEGLSCVLHFQRLCREAEGKTIKKAISN